MDIESQKAQAFIKRLLTNPALNHLQALQKEEQIIQFLNLNSQSLLPTLASGQFFPGKDWQQIFNLLYSALLSVINEALFSEIDALLQKIEFSFVSFLRQTNYPVSQCREQLSGFLKVLLEKQEARKAFIGPFIAVKIGISDRYIEQVFNRREYVHFELLKVQRLKMSKEEIKHFLKVSLLLRASIHLITVSGADLGIGTVSEIVQKSFADKVNQVIIEKLKLLPPEVIKSGVGSNLSFLENSDLETTARISAVFSMRCKNYKHIERVDRGAEYPDKSWFNIARRNYKFYGFDIKVLDEFYKIAAENGW
ncbi:MAG: hypothetical protein JW881_04865 [Spirochaetales bacterium]|nr:hypothetical protein [Spirochaetales bacterium]